MTIFVRIGDSEQWTMQNLSDNPPNAKWNRRKHRLEGEKHGTVRGFLHDNAMKMQYIHVQNVMLQI